MLNVKNNKIYEVSMQTESSSQSGPKTNSSLSRALSSFHGNSSENSDIQNRQQGEVLRPIRANQNSGLGAYKDTIVEENGEDGEEGGDGYIDDVNNNGGIFKNAFKRGVIQTEFSSRDKPSEKIISAAKAFKNFSSPDNIMQRRGGDGDGDDANGEKSSDIYLIYEDDNNDFSQNDSDKKIKIVSKKHSQEKCSDESLGPEEVKNNIFKNANIRFHTFGMQQNEASQNSVKISGDPLPDSKETPSNYKTKLKSLKLVSSSSESIISAQSVDHGGKNNVHNSNNNIADDDKEIGGQFADRAQFQAKSCENSPKAASGKKNKPDSTDKSFSISAAPICDNNHELQNAVSTPSKSKVNQNKDGIASTQPKSSTKKESRQMLLDKLNNQRKENHHLRLEHQRLAKEIYDLKQFCREERERQRNAFDQRLASIVRCKKIERKLKQQTAQNEKLKKQKAQMIRNTKQAEELYRETLNVKQQYEEIFCKLSQNPEIALLVIQADKTVRKEKEMQKLKESAEASMQQQLQSDKSSQQFKSSAKPQQFSSNNVPQSQSNKEGASITTISRRSRTPIMVSSTITKQRDKNSHSRQILRDKSTPNNTSTLKQPAASNLKIQHVPRTSSTSPPTSQNLPVPPKKFQTGNLAKNASSKIMPAKASKEDYLAHSSQKKFSQNQITDAFESNKSKATTMNSLQKHKKNAVVKKIFSSAISQYSNYPKSGRPKSVITDKKSNVLSASHQTDSINDE